MLLGELEKMVLNYFWTVAEADVKQVHGHFSRQRPGSLNTIQSTLDRLFKKELLTREKRGHAFVYSAACSRQAFIGRLVHSATRDFISPGQDNLVAAFVSLSSQLDDEQLNELEETIRRYEERNGLGKPRHD